MSKKNKFTEEQDDILQEVQEEIEDIETEEWEIVEDELCEETNCENIKQVEKQQEEKQEERCKETLARTMADFENFKRRVERDKEDMIFFLKQDIFKKILPLVDDLERIIKNTDPENTDTWIYEWAVSLYKKITKEFEKMWVKHFDSIGKKVNPDLHEVMTTIPWKEDIIVDEFEKGYKLNDRVLRHAKVVVWSWE